MVFKLIGGGLCAVTNVDYMTISVNIDLHRRPWSLSSSPMSHPVWILYTITTVHPRPFNQQPPHNNPPPSKVCHMSVEALLGRHTGFCIITCSFVFSKMLYARVYMWLNVTECHRRLATPGGLSDAFLDIIHVVISQ